MVRVVNAIILNKGKFLVIKRSGGIHSGKWTFPGGIVEPEESNSEALTREIKEEVGLEVKEIKRKVGEYSYPRENGEITSGESFEVSVKNTKVKPNYEVSDFKWVSLEDFENLDHIPGLEEEAFCAIFGQ